MIVIGSKHEQSKLSNHCCSKQILIEFNGCLSMLTDHFGTLQTYTKKSWSYCYPFYRTFSYNFSSKFTNRWSVKASTGVLQLSNLQLKDFGFFQCVVKNKVSEDYMVSLLVVTGMSHTPYSLMWTTIPKEIFITTCGLTKQRIIHKKVNIVLLPNKLKVFFLHVCKWLFRHFTLVTTFFQRVLITWLG